MEKSLSMAFAPTGEVVEYDLRHLSLYAAILDVVASSTDWRESASRLMKLDIDDPRAQACWLSHVERARWIVGAGLASAIEAFGLVK
ncbi:MAG TPA: hypothetical protein VF503_13200 [Sphingobium sp.]|uniref:hypothetical protein n=1 Tax=Sphingobium sp. TaxID=1912891 RepID=UPI002ED58248